MQEEYIPLKTRLEESLPVMKAELNAVHSKIGSFIHLAALVNVEECEKNSKLAWELNVGGAKKWFQAACDLEVKHFIYVSTSHVYAAPVEKVPIAEGAALGANSVYAQTKLEGERALAKMAARYPKTKLTIARVFSVLSPAMRKGFLLTKLHERAKSKNFSPISGLSNVRDFLKASEVVIKLCRLAEDLKSSEIVNVCSGVGITVREIAEEVFRQYDIDLGALKEEENTGNSVPWIVGKSKY